MKPGAGRALAILGLGAVCACAESPPPAQTPGRTVDLQQSSDAESESATDARVVRVVIRELDSDPILAREHIRVSVDLGVVGLEGSVGTRLAKDRAVEVARIVKGVRAILDRIAVTPRERPHGELELVVTAVLANDPVTAHQRIAVRAPGGIVHLSGDVDSMGARGIAERDALAVPGVVDVKDDLAVRPQRRSDDRLAAAVSRILEDDPWLDASRVRVSAHRGIVTLSGGVASAAELARAESDAREASPVRLDAAALQIDPIDNDDGTLRAKAEFASEDHEIAQALGDAYLLDPRVRPFSPTVRVRDRVVVLTGVAPTPAALRAAEEDALHVPGVAHVRDDMKERTQVVREDDEALRSDLARTIASVPNLGLLRVAVEVQRGRVILRGAVPTENDRAQIVALVSSAPGALDVDDGLTVTQTGLAYDAPPFVRQAPDRHGP